jgi:septum formation protein
VELIRGPGGAKLVLASASPRRRDLLDAIGLGFTVQPVDLDEAAVAGDRAPLDAAVTLATAKARAVTPPSGHVVLAADTMVLLDDEVLGKPADDADARRMLAALRSRTHTVVTGVAVRAPDSEWTAAIESQVRMRAYTDDEIAAYVAEGGGRDKAGAYGIQDEPFVPVETIEGCYCNVMGLPLWTAYRLLREAGCVAAKRPGDALARCAVCPMRG